MRKYFLLLVLFGTLCSFSLQAQDDYKKVNEMAVQLIECLQKGEYGKVVAHFDSTMKVAIPEEKLKGLMQQLDVQLGKIQEVGKDKIINSIVGGFREVAVPCQFEKGYFNLQFFFNNENQVSGFFVKPAVKPTANYQSQSDAYTSKDIRFENKQVGIKLAGTLTLPKNKSQFPGVILVSGSGAQDRNEEIMGQKPFERIADFLSSRGIAVLRYDDRGFGQSEGNYAQSNTYDFLSDALAGFDYLSNYEGIDKEKVGIIGHSEGAVIAAMAASENKEINFICMLAGLILKGDDLLLLQYRRISEVSGVDEQTMVNGLNRNKKTFEIVRNEPDNAKASELIKAEINTIDSLSDAEKSSQAASLCQQVLNPWMRAFLELDPQKYLSLVNCPALALFGEKDLQVPPKENINALKKLTNSMKVNPFAVQTVSGVNHLFQNAQTGLMNEYGNAKEVTMNDLTLNAICDWMKKF